MKTVALLFLLSAPLLAQGYIPLHLDTNGGASGGVAMVRMLEGAELPPAAFHYPLPQAWVERHGLRRFGFHGLSVAWSVTRATELLEDRGEALGIVEP